MLTNENYTYNPALPPKIWLRLLWCRTKKLPRANHLSLKNQCWGILESGFQGSRTSRSAKLSVFQNQHSNDSIASGLWGCNVPAFQAPWIPGFVVPRGSSRKFTGSSGATFSTSSPRTKKRMKQDKDWWKPTLTFKTNWSIRWTSGRFVPLLAGKRSFLRRCHVTRQ